MQGLRGKETKERFQPLIYTPKESQNSVEGILKSHLVLLPCS